ncbi:MAG: DUF2147 domain-containing protein [Terracidiphilus sp.]|jgi:uncharacterized protein (DUF2147 family)
MRWNPIAVGVLLLFAPVALAAQAGGVLGDWNDPLGSVIRIDRCGADVCLRIVSLSPTAPSTKDIHNPEPGLRGRALCGLEIGSGFSLRDPGHAVDGTLYDPKTGKTYHGSITAEGTADGGKLQLRGYVGIPLFGASQTWTRHTQALQACISGD